MSKISIRYNEYSLENNLDQQITQNYECKIVGNQIYYNDDNNATHVITINDYDLFIEINGSYKSYNHYKENELTNLELFLNDDKQLKLTINTSLLYIKTSYDMIIIELKYNLMDNGEIISNHHVFIEVK